MAVKIGSARSDERGRATGGAAGDQKRGLEVSTQSYYVHKKGWRVLRAKSVAAREAIAMQMEAACASDLIGYDQNQRETLRKAVEPYGWDIRKLNRAVETDCSALVRVCVAFAFGRDLGAGVSYFNTTTMCAQLLKSGQFEELMGAKYTASSAYLLRGDILCTKSQGHTVVVLTNGASAGSVTATAPASDVLGARLLKRGSVGEDVKLLQEALNALGFECGTADGEYGQKTEAAVRRMQTAARISADGQYGPASHAALMAMRTDADTETGGDEASGAKLRVTAAVSANIRAGAGTGFAIVTTAKRGAELSCLAKADNGWYCVQIPSGTGWISPKMAEVIA
jgi:hypothetical protein